MDDGSEAPTVANVEVKESELEHELLDDGGGPASGGWTRYHETGRLGAGSMGEVALCEDRRIGREIALKVATGLHREPSLRARFLREARIQAKLEHPSIVPVYDIGRDANGDPYFTMKRVRGLTLRQVLDALKARDPLLVPQYTRRRLLTAFATICMTVHYAHTREVLHRDLKPSNIMLGDYGELYVLDWGVARSAYIGEPSAALMGEDGPPDGTGAGEFVGTPGYIAPEQVRNEAIDRRADVYSLGTILFEILTLERLHPRDASVALMATLEAADRRPSLRVPQDGSIPPELDAICAKATALARADRYESARALHDAIDRYLEGDRDLERRRDLANEHTLHAQTLAEHALAGGDRSTQLSGRAGAMAEVSRALALDPANGAARQILFRLLTEPPREVPEEVARDLEQLHEAQQQRAARGGALLYLLFFFWAPLVILFADSRSITYFGLLTAIFGATAASLYRASRLPYATTRGSYLTIGMTSLALCALSGVVGPLLLVPTLVVTNAIGFLLRPNRFRRSAVILFSLGAVAVPQVLEWLGVVPPSSYIASGKAVFVNRVMDFTPATHFALFVFTLVVIVAFALYFSRFRDALTHAEERLYVHAWQLRQLLPDERRESVTRAAGFPGRP